MSPPRQRRLPPLLFWTLALALLAKAALPMLAAVAAGLQGRAVAEVCSVYGVRAGEAWHDEAHGAAPAGTPHPHGEAGLHAAGHCALGALPVLAGGPAPGLDAPRPPSAALPAGPTVCVVPCRDAAARWAARLGHGPPARS